MSDYSATSLPAAHHLLRTSRREWCSIARGGYHINTLDTLQRHLEKHKRREMQRAHNDVRPGFVNPQAYRSMGICVDGGMCTECTHLRAGDQIVVDPQLIGAIMRGEGVGLRVVT